MAEHLLKVGLVQHPCAIERYTNLKRTVTGIRDAARQGAQLILLQELHTSPYFCQSMDRAHFELAESIPGPTTEQLGRLASELGVVIIASLFERRGAGIYHNTALVLDADGSIAGRYRKMHIPDDPGYFEKYYFTPGDLGFQPIATAVGLLGVVICWDQWYPEAARLMALAGAEILLYPTAIGWSPGDTGEERQRQHTAWMTVQRAHAIANGIPVACCNRVGLEESPLDDQTGIEFWGTSFVAGPQGEILAEAPADEESVLIAEIDLNRSEQVRQEWPFLRDRRIDAYQGLMKRWED